MHEKSKDEKNSKKKKYFNYRCLDNKLKISTDLLLSNTSREVTSTSVFFFLCCSLYKHEPGRCECITSNGCSGITETIMNRFSCTVKRATIKKIDGKAELVKS